MFIAKRTLTAQLPDGTKQLLIGLYAPRNADGVSICEYVLEWPEGKRQSFGAGVDLVQALHSALQKIGLEIYTSAYHGSGILSWEQPGQGYGFPIPRNGRDLLVGEDKIFDG